MVSLKQQKSVVVTFLACLLLTGCGTTQPSRYYMLNSISHDTHEKPVNQNEAKVHIGVGPIKVPKYLDRYPIVKRSTGAEVIIDDTHRWAEPLADNLARVIANNLNLLVGAADISIHPWSNSNEMDYQIVVDVLRFDADMYNNIVLSAHWTITGKESKHSLYKQNTLIKEKADNGDYATLVSTQSKATEKLCQEIAGKLKEIMAQGNASL